MAQKSDQEEMNKALLANLVMMLSSSVMQQLGKLVDPGTGKAEIHLEAAQVTIDMLNMLKEKTKGNLDAEEDAMVSSTLAALQMNYVETAALAGRQEESATDHPAGTDTPGPGETGDAVTGETRKEKAEPKYRKSYGA